MIQIITKDGKGYCRTAVPYSEETIKQMKRAGYKVKVINDAAPADMRNKQKNGGSDNG